jgi:hypothetical protein
VSCCVSPSYQLKGDMQMKPEQDSPAADRLEGVEEIADFMGVRPRRARHLIDRGEWPAGHEGPGRLVGSKEVYRRIWKQLTGGNANAAKR